MTIIKRLSISLVGFMATIGLLSSVALAWEPSKPVNFIIKAGKGGGADKMARLMQAVVEKDNLAGRPLVPTNKSGGSGAEALIAAGTASDPDHTIMVTLNSFFTTPLIITFPYVLVKFSFEVRLLLDETQPRFTNTTFSVSSIRNGVYI